jgi:transcriptional regulator with XRE-family HTH domain
MRPQDFKRWRKALSLSQKEAAEALGLKRRVVQYYEKGERGGEKVKIPKTVRLACAALSQGLADYQGPEKAPAKKDGARKGAPKQPSGKAKGATKPKAAKQSAARKKAPAKRGAAGRGKSKR